MPLLHTRIRVKCPAEDGKEVDVGKVCLKPPKGCGYFSHVSFRGGVEVFVQCNCDRKGGE